MVADAPTELLDELRAVADSYRELAKIKDDSARGMAYIGSDVLDATGPIVKWQTDNCW